VIDTGAASLSLRSRLLSLSVCTTGSQTLAATGTGYSRAAGSFIADGFADGMEFVPAGFTDNTPRVIETVTALNIATTTANTAQTAGAGRSLSVGLPQGRAFGNREFKPTSGSPYVVVEFVPGAHSLLTATAQNGMATEDGLFVIKWYGLEKLGELGIEKCVDKVKALFTPGTVIGSVRVRSDTSVRSGQILPQGNGWALCQITVPWWALSNNAIAA
jgi:hypothetical protein